MKKLIIVISMLPVCASLAQTNWTFQWHGQEKGIIFCQTNLTKIVKTAIRDDIEQVMSHIAVSNAENYPTSPDHPDLGKIDGLINFTGKEHIWPDGFPISYYRIVNGVTNFVLSVEECTTYASAVALTNKHAAQISKLPAVIKQFTNGLDIAHMTLKQKEAYIWHPYLDEQKKRNKAEYESHITMGLSFGPNRIAALQPSVLSYCKEDIENKGVPLLVCKLYVRITYIDGPAPDTFTFVFRNGAWRWCPDIF